MRSASLVLLASALPLLAIASAVAQDLWTEANACITTLIRARLESEQPVRLSADTITLTGGTLRLTGRAWVRFNDTSVRADEVVVNQAAKQVEVVGNVNAFLGSAPTCGRPQQIEFR